MRIGDNRDVSRLLRHYCKHQQPLENLASENDGTKKLWYEHTRNMHSEALRAAQYALSGVYALGPFFPRFGSGRRKMHWDHMHRSICGLLNEKSSVARPMSMWNATLDKICEKRLAGWDFRRRTFSVVGCTLPR
jgi:hypothetical protein